MGLLFDIVAYAGILAAAPGLYTIARLLWAARRDRLLHEIDRDHEAYRARLRPRPWHPPPSVCDPPPGMSTVRKGPFR